MCWAVLWVFIHFHAVWPFWESLGIWCWYPKNKLQQLLSVLFVCLFLCISGSHSRVWGLATPLIVRSPLPRSAPVPSAKPISSGTGVLSVLLHPVIKVGKVFCSPPYHSKAVRTGWKHRSICLDISWPLKNYLSVASGDMALSMEWRWGLVQKLRFYLNWYGVPGGRPPSHPGLRDEGADGFPLRNQSILGSPTPTPLPFPLPWLFLLQDSVLPLSVVTSCTPQICFSYWL
jgi:hypothetical protein